MGVMFGVSWSDKWICKGLGNIPIEYLNDFNEKKNRINVFRFLLISKLISIVLIMAILVYVVAIWCSWLVNPVYYCIIYAHVFILLVFLIFHLIARYKKELLFNSVFQFNLELDLTIFITILWSIFLVINGQQIHVQISAYLIICLTFASFLLLNPVESIVIFFSSYIISEVGLLFFRIDFSILIGSTINGLFVVILSIIISNLNYSAAVNEFAYQKIIERENQTLLQTSNNLHKKIKEKELKLSETSKRLSREISIRHSIEKRELESFINYQQKHRLLEKAKENEKIKTEYFASMSHELKTPVNLIFTATQVLENQFKKSNKGKNPENIKKFLNIIKQNCYRQLRIINNLIDISKIDTTFFELDIKKCAIGKLVKEITYSVKEYANYKDIELTFSTENEEKIIACDPEKIERIVLNLLSNAIKFTPEGGQVLVSVLFENQSVFISVKDNGIGIPPKMQEKIFGRFIQVDKAKPFNKHGSGIGLSLVKSFVELHNGKIYLNSKEGVGSEFIIQLPDYCIGNMVIYSAKDQEARKELVNLEFSDFNFS